jgi:hypothetical protein
MKSKLLMVIPGILISMTAFSQDSSARSSNKVIFNNGPRVHSTIIPAQKNSLSQPHIYSDTRLGSSSPMYDTYEKNNYGAGAITTNPHKSGDATNPENTNSVQFNSNDNSTPIHSDTRLGSSSPLYDSYKKNNYGAGAITTDPHKSGGGSPLLPAPVSDTTHHVSDTLNNH